MSVIASGSNGIEKFDQTLLAILKMATATTRGQICNGPISRLVLNKTLNTTAIFGDFYQKMNNYYILSNIGP